MAYAVPALRQDRQDGLTGRPAGDLALRVCGSEYDGRIVRIRSAKCTIGSGRNCTLRLKARGIEPLHCLIVRGAQGMVVRRWARQTRLNGAAFFDSPLKVGDRLGIGALEFEVLPGGETSEESTLSAPDAARLAILNERVVALDTQLDAQTQALQAELQRREELQRQIEAQTRELDELRRQVDEHKSARDVAEHQLAAMISVDELHRREAEWSAERDALQRQLDEAQRAAANLITVEELDNQRRTWEQEKTQLEERLAHAQAAAAQAEGLASQWQREAESRVAAEEVQRSAESWRLRAEELERELQESRQASENKINELSEALQAAQRDRVAAEERAAQVAMQLATAPSADEVGTRETELQQRVAELQQELERCRSEADAERARRDEEVANLRNEWSRHEEQLRAELDAERSQFSEDVANLQNELRRKEEQLAAHDAALASQREGEAVWEQRARAGEEQIAELQRRLDEATANYAAERHSLEEQLRQLQNALQEAEQRAAQPQYQSAEPPVSEEAENRIKALELEAAQVRSELEHVRRDLEEARERHAAELAAWERTLQEKDAELTAQGEQVQQLRAELEKCEAELQRERERLAEREAELTRHPATLEAPPAEQNSYPDDISSTMVVPPPSATVPPVDGPPADDDYTATLVVSRRPDQGLFQDSSPSGGLTGAAAVLAKMGYKPFPDDEDETPPMGTSQAFGSTLGASPFGSPVTQSPPPASEESDDEDSIEDYMAKLLQRVRGADTVSSYRPAASAPTLSVTRTGPPPKPTLTTTSTSSAPSLVSILGGPTTDTSATQPKITPEEFQPRSQAPEVATRLAAMRDLANTSARSAIERYTQMQWFSMAVTKFLLALGATGAAIYLCVWGSARPWLAYAGAGLSAVSSTVWLVQSFKHMKCFLRARRDFLERASFRNTDLNPETPSAMNGSVSNNDDEAAATPPGEAERSEAPEDTPED